DEGLDGFILTNTTLDRETTPFYPKEGGVSGKPLKEKSIQALCTVKKLLDKKNEKKCLISTGGVMTEEDVFERIALGADLVQVYSTLVYEGPGFFRKVSDFVKHTEQQQTNSTRRS
ncbi:MAG: quinone-dependent dihydroorotate dehydrogenase, partial [Pseudobdellovibrio sp.]